MSHPLADLLIKFGTDTASLDRFRADPNAALDAAGITAEYTRAVLKGGNSNWIRGLVGGTRTLPDTGDIESQVTARSVDDPAFLAQLQAEPRLTVERTISVKLPAAYDVEVTGQVSSGLVVRVVYNGSDAAPLTWDYQQDPNQNPPPPVDVVIDADIDVDIDIDAVVVVDVDVDIDTDTASSLTSVDGSRVAMSRRTDYWSAKRAIWREENARTVLAS